MNNNNNNTSSSFKNNPEHQTSQFLLQQQNNTRKFSLNKDVFNYSMMINNHSTTTSLPPNPNHYFSASSPSSPLLLSNNNNLLYNNSSTFSNSNNLLMIDPDRRRSSTTSGDSPTSNSGFGTINSNNSGNSILYLNLMENSSSSSSPALSVEDLTVNNNNNNNNSSSRRPTINHQRNRHKGSGGISEYSFTVDDLIVPNNDHHTIISSPRLANLNLNQSSSSSSNSNNINNKTASSQQQHANKQPQNSNSITTTTATFVPYISTSNSNNNAALDVNNNNNLGTTEFVNLDLTSILPHGKLLRFFLVNNQDYFTDTVQLRKHSPVIVQEIDYHQQQQRSLNEFEYNSTSSGFFSDISIRFLPSGREIHAHKFILSMYSPVLAALFSSRWKETHDNVIEVTTEGSTAVGGGSGGGVNSQNFEDVDDEQLFVEMILCMYSGQIYQVEQHLIVPLLELSDKYQFTELSRACEEYLRVHLNEHNCISLLYLANGSPLINSTSFTSTGISNSSKYSKGKFDRLKERALTYIDTHFELVSKTKSYLFLDIDMLIFLLNRRELRVDSEDVILSAVLNWCDGDLTNRRELLFSTLLEHVRLYHLSPNRLAHLGEVLEKYTCVVSVSVNNSETMSSGSSSSLVMLPWMNRIMQAMSYQMSHTLGFQLSQTMQHKIAIECPPRKRATQDITRISNLLSQEQFLQILEWINEPKEGKQGGGLMKDLSEREWLLLYRGTRDGFQGKTFHSKCDGKGESFCVVKTDKGFLFGGFTSKSWHSNNTDESDECAFLYSLYNPYLNNKMTRFKIKAGMSAAIGCYANFGVIFGGGRDLILYSESNINNSSHCEFFGHTYQLPNLAGVYYGSLKSKTFFNGTEQFRVNDCEVFGLVPSSNKQMMKI